jgi:hypothetical protein
VRETALVVEEKGAKLPINYEFFVMIEIGEDFVNG